MLDPRLEKIPHLWCAESLISIKETVIGSGCPQLDQALGGGWPCPALIEVLCDQQGIGELHFLLPLITQRCQPVNQQRVPALWLNPPHAIHAAALLQHGLDPTQHWLCEDLSERDTAWAMEQALRSTACAIVIAWTAHCRMAVLRRLKLAAIAGRCLGVLFRPAHAARAPSPATIRLALTAHASHTRIAVLKAQGQRASSVLVNIEQRFGTDATSTAM